MKKNITKKLLAVATAVILLLSVLSISALAAEKDEVVKDGTYTKTVTVVNDGRDDNYWDNYDLAVTLKVDDGKITSITGEPGNGYDSGNDAYFSKAFTKSKGINTLLAGQDATGATVDSWDAVSGATLTAEAAKQAVLDLMAEAEAATTEPEVTTYTVTFVSLTETFATQEVEEGKTAKTPATNPTSEGQVFAGWYVDEDTPYNFNTPVTQNLTLQAKFNDDTTGNPNSVSLETVKVDKVVKTATNITKPDEQYSFKLTPATTDTPNYPAQLAVNTEGNLYFGSVVFPGPGNYAYILSETAGNTEGMTYDSTQYYIQLKVEQDKNGKLWLTEFKLSPNDDRTKKADSATFTNIYNPETKLTITKNVVNASTEEQGRKFKFAINFENPGIDGTVTTTDKAGTSTSVVYGTDYAFELADSDVITFTMPAGTDYTLTETGVAGYEAKAVVVSDGKETTDGTSGKAGASITVNSTAMINENSVTVTNTYKVNALTGLARKNAGVIVLMLLAAAVIAYLVYDKKRKLAAEQE